MKKLLILSLMALAIQTQAQNVGINKLNPQESLDVSGNINLSGTIKANGVGGTAGQVLQNNGNGTMAWATLGGSQNYQNSRLFSTNTTFTIPTGVTKVMIELWSAGAGGSGVAGGMSGSYGRVTKTVTPMSTINIVIGLGGEGQSGTTLPTGGGNTQVTFSDDASTFQILGAEAPQGDGWQGFPGTYSSSMYPDYFQAGNLGEMVMPKIVNYPNGEYLEIIDTGRGGFPPGINYNSMSVNSSQYVRKYNSSGGLISQNMQRPPYIVNNYYATGGGYDSETVGFVGAGGLAIVWW